MEPTSEQLLAAYNQAPQVIQDALTDGVAADFMISLTARYALHIDVTGQVIKAIRNMLLGFLSPGEFINAVMRAGVERETAQRLTADLNQEVFIPLRDQVRHSEPARPQPAHQTMAQVPMIEVISKPSVPVTALPPSTMAPPFNLMRPDALVTAPPQQESFIPTPQPKYAGTVSVPLQIRTMQHDMEIVQHPERAPQALHPSQTTPARSFQTASVPVTSKPAAPAQPVPVPHQDVTFTPRPNASNAPLATPGAQIPLSTGDPYREPV